MGVPETGPTRRREGRRACCRTSASTAFPRWGSERVWIGRSTSTLPVETGSTWSWRWRGQKRRRARKIGRRADGARSGSASATMLDCLCHLKRVKAASESRIGSRNFRKGGGRSLPVPSYPVLFPFPVSLPSLSPFEVGPLNQLGGAGERCIRIISEVL